ncbi:NAD(P)-dependent oxidoreductase [Idiomarina baltica]|uniref:NAD(P)-dependent oxidoreductase n=1 Tax=Idiomarina baltica TaxID=190892 RepID=UPI002354A660|nr:NAD(P)-dependent oxidoreductase [Idiomarina baltica]
MTQIAFLGLGAMGIRMAQHLIDAGHSLTVWNRTESRAEPLLEQGAQWADTPAEAAQGAELVIAMVRDDDASAAVWLDEQTGAFKGMDKDAIAIESSTLSVDWVKELAQHAQQRGKQLIEAPVSGSRPQAQNAELVYLVGGDAHLVKRAEPVLSLMGKKVNHTGEMGSGALAKLVTNTLMGIQVTTIAELIGMLKRQGQDPDAILEAVSTTPVWSKTAGIVRKSMVSEAYAPQFPVDLIEKDLGYCLQAADQVAPMTSAARTVFNEAQEQQLGEWNMTVVAKLYE